MSIIDYFISPIKREEIGKEYLDKYIHNLKIKPKSIKKDDHKWKLIIEGVKLDSLGDGLMEIPFMEEYHFKIKKDAEDLGILSSKDASISEIWKLVKRW